MGNEWTEDELDDFRNNPDYFVSVTGNVYKNDKDYAFKVIQSTLKSNRNTFKYLAKGLEADVMSDVEKILNGVQYTIKSYSENQVNAMTEIG